MGSERAGGERPDAIRHQETLEARGSLGARHNVGGTSSQKDPDTGSEIAGPREDSSTGIISSLGLPRVEGRVSKGNLVSTPTDIGSNERIHN